MGRWQTSPPNAPPIARADDVTAGETAPPTRNRPEGVMLLQLPDGITSEIEAVSVRREWWK